MCGPACKKVTNPLEGVSLIVNYDVVKTTFDIQFLDAATGELIGESGDLELTITPVGQDRYHVLDISGVHYEQYYSGNGKLSLGIDPAIVPTPENPVSFTLLVSGGNYLPSAKYIMADR